MGGRGGSSMSARAGAGGGAVTVSDAADRYADRALRNYAPGYFDSMGARLPDFVFDKLSPAERAAVKSSGHMAIARETEKAYQISARTDFGEVKFWAPKSVLKSPAEAKKAAHDSARRFYINGKYGNYLKKLADDNGVKLGKTTSWDAIRKKLDKKGIPSMSRDAYAGMRHDES